MIEILNGDSFKLISNIKDNSVDCIITDPPYFLSNGGITCKSGKMVSVNKTNTFRKMTQKLTEHSKFSFF